ncbi:MAG: SAM-dependent methyltransferase [Cyanobacteria bacterium P01_C01_bin.69]
MAMQLDQVVPFGRSFDEYVRMFLLSEADLQCSILSVADGPASFNAEGMERGYRIQSCDPLYAFGADEIKVRFNAVVDGIIEQVENTADSWVWSYHASPAALKAHRVEVMERFCEDYEQGRQEGRYRVGALPKLDYADACYDIGLSSHFLFLYSEQLDLDFHVGAIADMLRICKEVRIFPLLTLAQKRSPYVASVMAQLKQAGYETRIETVDYELQLGGNEMLRICRVD